MRSEITPWAFLLHGDGDRGKRTAAILISVVRSCKLHRVEPWAYIRDVLNRVSTHPAPSEADR